VATRRDVHLALGYSWPRQMQGCGGTAAQGHGRMSVRGQGAAIGLRTRPGCGAWSRGLRNPHGARSIARDARRLYTGARDTERTL
jgi:hypothetical protein